MKDLSEVRLFIDAICVHDEGEHYLNSFPARMDKVRLHQIARDLREVEVAYRNNIEYPDSIHRPMDLIICLLNGRAREVGVSCRVECSAAQAYLWLGPYQYYHDREVVRRALRLGKNIDEDQIISFLDREIALLPVE